MLSHFDLEAIARDVPRGGAGFAVDPIDLARTVGELRNLGTVKVYNSESGTSDDIFRAITMTYPDEIRILVNNNVSDEWKRFVIVKEIAHFLLPERVNDPDESVDGLLTRGPLQAEEEASYLARALLIPQDDAIEASKRLRDIDQLARLFQVPRAVMEQRLSDLGVEK